MVFDITKMSLNDVLNIIINTNNAYLHWCRLYQSDTDQLRIGKGFVSFIINNDQSLSLYGYGEGSEAIYNKMPELRNRPNVYITIGQDITNLYPSELTIWETIDFFINNRVRELKIHRGEKGYASWGEITYQINNYQRPVLVASNVDSSG
ncbi:MAG: hypothetical protein GYA51_16695 [Candidatus Methanofastidiosa archaeon]|nr:hypothetical protein [Candidatus Methanofastidiosa archaeon]